MKRSILVALVLSLVGCSSLGVSGDTKAKLCQDAQMGYNLSLAMLDTQLTAAGNQYWLAYKVGAGLAIQMYCAGFTTPVPAVTQ